MHESATIPQPARHGSASRLAAALQSEVALARLAVGVVALHVVDDNFLQPNPGTSAADHLVSGLVPLAILSAAGVLYGRVRAGVRASIALVLGFLAILGGTEAVHYARSVGLSGDDYTGLLSVGAGLLLLGLGTRTLWRSRRRDDRLWWRYTRRGLVTLGALLIAVLVLFPVTLAYTGTHLARAKAPPPDLGAPFEEIEFTTSDGLRLKGWYIASKNGAAVISFPGRAASQKRAKMLARHGYGVLLFDRRGEGESDGDPNIYGWHGERDIHAAVEFLRGRPDVDPQRIGGIGLSVGGEMMIEAAAESSALKAIVSEGGSARSVRDLVANPGNGLLAVLANVVTTASTAVFTNDLPPADLESLVPRVSGAIFFMYGEHGQAAEEPANTSFYAVAHEPKEIWKIPGAKHMGGADAQPAEYERRIVRFFDRALLDRRSTAP
jgi:dienelactone hydrolase